MPRLPEQVEITRVRLPITLVSEEERVPVRSPWMTFCIDSTSQYILGYAITLDPVSDSDVTKFLDGDGVGN